MRLSLLTLTLTLTLGACASTSFPSDAEATRARDVPDHFLVGSHTDDATAEPRPGEGCRNPMVDPRDGTRLTLDRSTDRRGDYVVPEGRYGVGGGRLLRLDCATGRPVGVVRR